MTIIDTTSGIQDIFIDGHFDLSKWEEYIEKFVPGAKDICLNDMMDCRNAGYTWEKDYLPILDSVYSDINRRDKAIESFAQVTSNLDDRIYEVFHRTVDMDVGYYLGTRFVRFMMETDSFDNIINYRLNKVKEEFKRFGAKGEKNVFSERGVTKKIHKCL